MQGSCFLVELGGLLDGWGSTAQTSRTVCNLVCHVEMLALWYVLFVTAQLASIESKAELWDQIFFCANDIIHELDVQYTIFCIKGFEEHGQGWYHGKCCA